MLDMPPVPREAAKLAKEAAKAARGKGGSGEDVVVAVHVAEQIQIKESYPTPPRAHLELRKEENNSHKPSPGEVSLWCPKPQREAWVIIFYGLSVNLQSFTLSERFR